MNGIGISSFKGRHEAHPVYAFSVIDAYVDAQLFDFDISPDLSMQVEPAVYYDPVMQRANGEVHLAITF